MNVNMRTKTVLILTAFLLAGTCLGGCATTKPAFKDTIRAVEKVEDSGLDTKELRVQAQDFFTQSHFQEAANAYQVLLLKLPKNDPDRTALLFEYAQSALALSAQDDRYIAETELAYERLIAQDDVTPEMKNHILSGQALLALRGGYPDKTEKLLLAAIRANPDDVRLRNGLGQFYDQSSDWISALDVYVGALTVAHDVGHDTAAILNNIGVSLMMQGRTKEALVKFNTVVQENPNTEVYANNRRMAFLLLGRTREAFQTLDDISSARLYNDAGYIAASRGEMGKARGFYKKAISTSPVYFKTAEQNLTKLDDEERSRKSKSDAAYTAQRAEHVAQPDEAIPAPALKPKGRQL
jgi:tetratricopeptide (TPR) repeat protein